MSAGLEISFSGPSMSLFSKIFSFRVEVPAIKLINLEKT